jgi:hypothetical protein
VRCNDASRRHQVKRVNRSWQHSLHVEREASTVPRRELHEWRVHRRHGLAAILTVMALRRARHRIAALHRLFRCCHASTVECVGHKTHCHNRCEN